MDEKKFNKLLKSFKTNSKACDKLADFYYSRIVIHIQMKYPKKDLGQDVAQEFFLKLFKIKLPDYVENPNAWVYKVCNNIAKDFLLSEKNYNRAYCDEKKQKKMIC